MYSENQAAAYLSVKIYGESRRRPYKYSEKKRKVPQNRRAVELFDSSRLQLIINWISSLKMQQILYPERLQRFGDDGIILGKAFKLVRVGTESKVFSSKFDIAFNDFYIGLENAQSARFGI